jgi:catechol 2,3-dioxygenase-like lactoylglutathione lyase family enzyme
MPGFHHVELWVENFAEERASWAWILGELGFVRAQQWPEGESWSAGGVYLTLVRSPKLSASRHDRRRPGLNHLAFLGGDRSSVDEIMRSAPSHGWRPLYADRYPHAGGPDHYAGWLENAAGFKVEIVSEAAE